MNLLGIVAPPRVLELSWNAVLAVRPKAHRRHLDGLTDRHLDLARLGTASIAIMARFSRSPTIMS